MLPQYFLGVFLLSALIGLVVLFSSLLTDKDMTRQDMNIALVMNNNAFLSTFGTDVLESSSSAGGLCSFVQVDSETAMAGLDDGTFSGVINFPDHFVGTALSGKEDVQAQMYMP